jgi:hypothetical protein
LFWKFSATNAMSERSDRSLKSSMPARLPAMRWMGPAAPVVVTGTWSSVPWSVLENHTALLWYSIPLAPMPFPDGEGVRAGPVSHAFAGPPEAGTAQIVPATLSATYRVRLLESRVSPLRTVEVEVEVVRERTGWSFPIAEDLAVEPPPTPAELADLRAFDPTGLFLRGRTA